MCPLLGALFFPYSFRAIEKNMAVGDTYIHTSSDLALLGHLPLEGKASGGASPAPTSVILVRRRWNMAVGDISAGFMPGYAPQKPHTIRLKNLSSSALVSFTLTGLPWGQ